MNCPKCGDDLLPNANNCRCGWSAYKAYGRDDPALLAAKERAEDAASKFGKGDPSRDWAHKIIQRRDAGEIIAPAVLAKAMAATGGV